MSNLLAPSLAAGFHATSMHDPLPPENSVPSLYDSLTDNGDPSGILSDPNVLTGFLRSLLPWANIDPAQAPPRFDAGAAVARGEGGGGGGDGNMRMPTLQEVFEMLGLNAQGRPAPPPPPPPNDND